MSMVYMAAEADYLKQKAEARGDCIDLVLCSDGVLRTAEEKSRFEAYSSQCGRPGLLGH